MEKEQNRISYWNKQGIFIRPTESESEYYSRTEKIPIYNSISAETSLLLVYDFTPQWIEVSYSNKGIYFFEAGCSWIEERDNREHIHIQLKTHFQNHDYLFGLYSKEEVLTHEYVHAARFQFSDSKYDEHFCYYLSKGHGLLGNIRAFLGPLFQSHYELIALAIFLTLAAFAQFLHPGISIISLILPIAFLSVTLARLLIRWRKWLGCKKNLSDLFSNPLFIMLRLTDEELELFAKSTSRKIRSWIVDQTSFRWITLQSIYPFKT